MRSSLTVTSILFNLKILLLFSCIGFGQKPNVIDIQNKGLSELNRQYSLFVNHEGLLYIGANDGMFTFDGVNYKTLVTTSILSKAVNGIKSDEANRIWCKNFSNELFQIRNDTLFVHEGVTSYLIKESKNLVDYVTYENDIYFITDGQLAKYSEKDGVEVLVNSSGILKTNERFNSVIFTSLVKSGNNLYLASLNELYQYDLKTKDLKSHKAFKGQKVLTVFNQMPYMIIKGGEQKIANIFGVPSVVTGLKGNTIFYNITTVADELWLCTSDGLYSLTSHYWLLKGERVTDVVQDLEGGLWISSLDNGLFYIPDMSIRKVLSTNDNNEQFTRIIIRGNELFAGTNRGKIYVLNTSNNSKREIVPEVQREIEAFYLKDNFLYSSSGLYDLNTSRYVNNEYYGKHLTMDDIGNLVNANSGYAGIIPFGMNTKPNLTHGMKRSRLIDFANGTSKIYPFRFNRSNAVHFCHFNKCYYIAYSDGLRIFYPDGDEKEISMPDGKKIIATSFASDELGNTYIGTVNQGVIIMNNDLLIQNITVQNGLSNNYCRRLFYQDGVIWVLTKNSLDFIQNNEVENIGAKLAINYLEIKDIAFKEGNLYMATKTGIIEIDKSTIHRKIALPKPRIKSFSGETELTSGVELPYSQNNLRFRLEAIFYGTFGNYTFEYRIKELNNEWKSQFSSSNDVNYLNFSPGDYTFESRLRAGSEVSEIASIAFKIKQPFWTQNWFVLSAILIAFSLVIFLINQGFQRIKSKEQVKTALAQSQITALRSQMNPHFLFNVLNAVQGYIYANEKVKASNYIGDFSDLMRNTLQFSDKLEIALIDEVKTIELYVQLEKARFEDEFIFEVQKDQKLDLNEYLIPSLIVQPFVENAIKHGLRHITGTKRLVMHIGEHDEFIKIIITDNGIGRKKSAIINKQLQKHTSYAISSIDKRINLINSLNDNKIKYTIDDVNSHEDNTGTRVEIWIPKKNKYESNNS
jgi:ligand-binding sensor domain-containing protein